MKVLGWYIAQVVAVIFGLLTVRRAPAIASIATEEGGLFNATFFINIWNSYIKSNRSITLKNTIILFIFLFISCTSGDKSDLSFTDKNKKDITLSVGDVQEFNWPANTKVDRIIYLETNDSSLISEITQLVVTDENLIIFDSHQKKIFKYNSSGKIINILEKIGLGATEYSEAKDVYVNLERNEYEILDRYEIKKYDIDSENYKGKIRLELSDERIPMQFININNEDVYYIWSNNPVSLEVNFFGKKDLDFYHLIKYDAKKGLISKSIRHTYGALDTRRFYRSNLDSIYNLSPTMGDNNLYRLSENQLSIKYSFPFSEKSVPESILMNALQSGGEYLMSDYFKSITHFFEVDDYLFFDFLGEEGKAYHVIFDKRKDLVREIGKSKTILPRVVSTDKNYFYAYVLPSDLLSRFEEDKGLINSIFFKNINFENISENDNPILIKFHIEE